MNHNKYQFTTNMSNRPSAPLLVTVNVTGACDLSCKYCYYRPRKKNHMPLENYEKALAILRNHHIFFLMLSGGDPFLHPEIDYMIDLAHQSFYQVSVLTNGTRISEKNLETIRRIVHTKGSFPIQVSIDSIDPKINDDLRGSTSVVMENIRRINQSGASITIAIVISSHNVDHVTDTVLALKDTAEGFHIMPIKPVPYLVGKDAYLMVENQKLEKAWDELIDIRKKHGLQIKIPADSLCHTVETSAHGAPCMAGFTKLAIDPNLDVRPCDKLVEKVVGNLENESLEDIWFGSTLADIYQGELPGCMVELNMDGCTQLEVSNQV